MKQNCVCSTLSVLAVLSVPVTAPPTVYAGEIDVTGCFLSLKDEAEIPARERGLLREILVQPGDEVTTDQVVAALEDRDARLALELAQIDLEIAVKQQTEGAEVQIAETALEEATRLTEQARLEQQLSARQAESEIGIRQAIAAKELAQDARDRAVESREEFRSSVSSREMATLEYELNKARMDVEQARYDQSLQQLRADSQRAIVEQRVTVERQKQLELSEARLSEGISGLTVRQMETSAKVAAERLQRLQIQSPLTGLVVEQLRHPGEWVEAGDPVVRVIRLDVLFVEGFVAADLVDQSYRGRPVSVTGDTRDGTATVSGRVVFVSPEIDPVNGQVQVRAEISNQQLKLRPGQQVGMVIRAE